MRQRCCTHQHIEPHSKRTKHSSSHNGRDKQLARGTQAMTRLSRLGRDGKQTTACIVAHSCTKQVPTTLQGNKLEQDLPLLWGTREDLCRRSHFLLPNSIQQYILHTTRPKRGQTVSQAKNEESQDSHNVTPTSTGSVWFIEEAKGEISPRIKCTNAATASFQNITKPMHTSTSSYIPMVASLYTKKLPATSRNRKNFATASATTTAQQSTTPIPTSEE